MGCRLAVIAPRCWSLSRGRTARRVLYAGFIREGLWHSTDYGATWHKLFPTDDRIMNASAVACGGPSGSQLVVVSEPLYWSQSESGIHTSFDAGEHWHSMDAGAFGAVRWKGVDIDLHDGTIHACTCGNGCFYLTPRR